MQENSNIAVAEKVKTSFDKVFSSEDGQVVLTEISGIVMGDLLKYEQDPHRLYYKEGQRSILLMILNIMNTDLSEYLKAYKKMKSMYDAEGFVN